jgi:hypothetical protein
MFGTVNYVTIQMKTNLTCPRCGKNNLADVHTCTPKQDQSIDLNASAAYLETLAPQWRKKNPDHVTDVLWGIGFAERHHGIGVGDD